jgi:hypothetical protein
LSEEGVPAFFLEANAVALGEGFDFDDGGGHVVGCRLSVVGCG